MTSRRDDIPYLQKERLLGARILSLANANTDEIGKDQVQKNRLESGIQKRANRPKKAERGPVSRESARKENE